MLRKSMTALVVGVTLAVATAMASPAAAATFYGTISGHVGDGDTGSVDDPNNLFGPTGIASKPFTLAVSFDIDGASFSDGTTNARGGSTEGGGPFGTARLTINDISYSFSGRFAGGVATNASAVGFIILEYGAPFGLVSGRIEAPGSTLPATFADTGSANGLTAASNFNIFSFQYAPEEADGPYTNAVLYAESASFGPAAAATVPELETWAMLLGGLGMIGCAARVRPRVTVALGGRS